MANVDRLAGICGLVKGTLSVDEDWQLIRIPEAIRTPGRMVVVIGWNMDKIDRR